MSDERTDEWHEGYAAFIKGIEENPYDFSDEWDKRADWFIGWSRSYKDWAELLGVSA